MQEALPWIIALAVLVVVVAGMAFWVTRPRPLDNVPLPTEWTVGPRTVFTVEERRAYRLLREAFASHVVLAKLPLVRFCQPADVQEMRYWFELLGSIHVSFAICTPQGRVLATIDLDGERPASRRTQQIKQNVLAACRIRYLRCTIDHLPSAAELQMLLPSPPGAPAEALPVVRASAPPPEAATDLARPTGTAPGFAAVEPSAEPPAALVRRAPPSPAVPQVVHDVRPADTRPRKVRKPLWQDSGLFQDSFFGIDNLRDAGPQSESGAALGEALRGRGGAAPVPAISADPAQGMLESELAKLKRPGPR